jgi:hypothetical protein
MRPLVVEASRVLWHRLHANHLAERLPAGSYATAAFVGLQDSAPRAAVVALHARVEQVGSGDWEHPSLVQTWAPRGAVFVVPRVDLAVFTLGISPREPEVRRSLKRLSAAAVRVVQEGCTDKRDVTLGPVPPSVKAHFKGRPVQRIAFALAGVQLRWDARTTRLLAGSAPLMDEEDARRELARRFLRSLGPAQPEQFARWAAVGVADARATFDAISSELVETKWPGGAGVMLARDAEDLAIAAPVAGVRLLPFGADPLLQPGNEVLHLEAAYRRGALPPWASTGLAVIDGEAVASWGRSGRRVRIFSLTELEPQRREAIQCEAESMPFPGPGTEVVWT